MYLFDDLLPNILQMQTAGAGCSRAGGKMNYVRQKKPSQVQNLICPSSGKIGLEEEDTDMMLHGGSGRWPRQRRGSRPPVGSSSLVAKKEGFHASHSSHGMQDRLT